MLHNATRTALPVRKTLRRLEKQGIVPSKPHQKGSDKIDDSLLNPCVTQTTIRLEGEFTTI